MNGQTASRMADAVIVGSISIDGPEFTVRAAGPAGRFERGYSMTDTNASPSEFILKKKAAIVSAYALGLVYGAGHDRLNDGTQWVSSRDASRVGDDIAELVGAQMLDIELYRRDKVFVCYLKGGEMEKFRNGYNAPAIQTVKRGRPAKKAATDTETPNAQP